MFVAIQITDDIFFFYACIFKNIFLKLLLRFPLTSFFLFSENAAAPGVRFSDSDERYDEYEYEDSEAEDGERHGEERVERVERKGETAAPDMRVRHRSFSLHFKRKVKPIPPESSMFIFSSTNR